MEWFLYNKKVLALNGCCSAVWSSSVSLPTKLKLHNGYILTVLLYSSHTWNETALNFCRFKIPTRMQEKKFQGPFWNLQGPFSRVIKAIFSCFGGLQSTSEQLVLINVSTDPSNYK